MMARRMAVLPALGTTGLILAEMAAELCMSRAMAVVLVVQEIRTSEEVFHDGAAAFFVQVAWVWTTILTLVVIGGGLRAAEASSKHLRVSDHIQHSRPSRLRAHSLCPIDSQRFGSGREQNDFPRSSFMNDCPTW